MPILFSGNYKCDKCNKNIEWNYFEATKTRMSATTYSIEKKPDGLLYIHSAKKMYNGRYRLTVNCPYCRYDNTFFYDTTQVNK